MNDISMIQYLRKRIKELEEGECRFNCRTQKAAFFSGYKLAIGDAFQEWDNDIMEAAYEVWRLDQKD